MFFLHFFHFPFLFEFDFKDLKSIGPRHGGMVDGGSIFSMMPPMLIRFPTAVAESLSPTYQYIYI